LGLTDSAKDRFIQQTYALLNLMSFFTAGPMEARAWTITRGTTAVKAAARSTQISNADSSAPKS
jgi:ribosome-binding ATPase YchF (GTP1/OBG family)